MSRKYFSCHMYFNTLSCQNYFSRGYGGVQNSSGNCGGVGGYFSGQKMEILGRRGAYVEFPPRWFFFQETTASPPLPTTTTTSENAS